MPVGAGTGTTIGLCGRKVELNTLCLGGYSAVAESDGTGLAATCSDSLGLDTCIATGLESIDRVEDGFDTRRCFGI